MQSKALFKIQYVLIILYVILNFLGTPLVKYLYLIICFFVLAGLISSGLRKNIYALLILALIEGQGRILWGYNSVSRIVFDCLLVLGITKDLIKDRRLFDLKLVPKSLVTLIILHFCWFGLELFNPKGAGILPSFATSKYYIFPFFLFLSLVMNKFDIYSEEFQKFIDYYSVIVFLICLLCVKQMMMGADFMHSISPYYSNLFEKFKVFGGSNFRPWGTTYVPGGFSGYIFLSGGFTVLKFLADKNLNKQKVFCYLALTIFSFYILFIGQVRAFLLRYILFVIIMVIAYIMIKKVKVSKIVFGFTLAALISFVGIKLVSTLVGDQIDTKTSLNRLIELENEGILAQRMGIARLYETLERRVQLPFGVGPGMTSNFLPQFAEARRAHIGLEQGYFWGNDNLIYLVIFELGIGGFVYVLILILNILIQFSGIIYCAKKGETRSALIMSGAFAMVLINFLGSYGSSSLLFNPESFYYWFWSAIGLIVYNEAGGKIVIDEEKKDLRYDSPAT